MLQRTTLTVFILLIYSTIYAQTADSLLNNLTAGQKEITTKAAFKATHIILTHSTETQKKHDLDFMIRHQFGDIGGEFGSSHTLFGLDVAPDLYIGFDYGITDKLTVSIGRSKSNELYNSYIKYKLFTQNGGDGGNFPLNITVVGQTAIVTRKETSLNEFARYADRLSYFFQPLFSRAISDKLSLQLAPSLLYRRRTYEPNDPKAIFSMGLGGRFKITKRLSFLADYTWVNGLNRPKSLSKKFYNPLGVGLEIETGGHVFSLYFLNSENIIENAYIPNTQKSWGKSGVRFGFTISRNFTLFKSKDKDLQTKIY